MTIPVTISQVSPAIEVDIPGVSPNGFRQFLNSLGFHVYNVELLYMSAESYQQLYQVLNYNYTNADGNGYGFPLVFYTDPYQSQPSIFFKTDATKVILDNNSNLNFAVLKNSFLRFKFLGNRITNSDPLSNLGFNHFKEMDELMNVDFFGDYSNFLIHEYADK